MRKLGLAAGMLLAASGGVYAGSPDDDRIYMRGDANQDLRVDSSDATFISSWLFEGGTRPGCLNQADANNDGRVDNSDPIYILNWLFNGGSEPPAPGTSGQCTKDDEPYPGCEVLTACPLSTA